MADCQFGTPIAFETVMPYSCAITAQESSPSWADKPNTVSINCRLKCLAYADDLLVCCKASEINNIFNLFDDFYDATGSKLSVQKTSVLCATHARNNINNNIACNLLSDEIKFCGLFYTIDNFNKLSDRNWTA